jgi:hypothetical protein
MCAKSGGNRHPRVRIAIDSNEDKTHENRGNPPDSSLSPSREKAGVRGFRGRRYDVRASPRLEHERRRASPHVAPPINAISPGFCRILLKDSANHNRHADNGLRRVFRISHEAGRVFRDRHASLAVVSPLPNSLARQRLRRTPSPSPSPPPNNREQRAFTILMSPSRVERSFAARAYLQFLGCVQHRRSSLVTALVVVAGNTIVSGHSCDHQPSRAPWHHSPSPIPHDSSFIFSAAS